MNKQDLINLIGNKLDAAKNEYTVAFDIFIQKIADKLAVTETIRIPEIGIFQLIKKTKSDGLKKNYSEPVRDEYLLLYVPLQYNRSEPEEIISIAVKEKKAVTVGSIDSVFSMSYGKPLIPVSSSGKKELYIQSSYLMLQKSFEEKSNILLDRSVLLTDFKLDYKPEQKELTISSLIETPEKEKIDNLEEEGQIPWDFGLPLLEISSPVEYGPEEVTEEMEVATEEPEAKKEGSDELINEEETFESAELKIDESDISEEKFNDDFFQSDPFDEFDKDKFLIPEEDEHKEDTSEIFKELLVENHNWELESEEISEQEKESFADHLEDELDKLDEQDLHETEEASPFANAEADESETFNLVPESLPISEENVPEPVVDPISGNEFTIGSEEIKKGMGFKFWFAIIVFVIISGSGFYYFFFSAKKQEKVTTNIPPKKIEAQIIERDYSIPVSVIPKETKSNSATDTVPEKIPDTKKAVQENTATTSEVENKKSDEASALFRNDNKTKIVKEYIFTDGKRYTIQNSSWKSKSYAEKETTRLRNLGFDAYIAVSGSTAASAWYRVRIGDFATIAEAEAELKKIQ